MFRRRKPSSRTVHGPSRVGSRLGPPPTMGALCVPETPALRAPDRLDRGGGGRAGALPLGDVAAASGRGRLPARRPLVAAASRTASTAPTSSTVRRRSSRSSGSPTGSAALRAAGAGRRRDLRLRAPGGRHGASLATDAAGLSRERADRVAAWTAVVAAGLVGNAGVDVVSAKGEHLGIPAGHGRLLARARCPEEVLDLPGAAGRADGHAGRRSQAEHGRRPRVRRRAPARHRARRPSARRGPARGSARPPRPAPWCPSSPPSCGPSWRRGPRHPLVHRGRLPPRRGRRAGRAAELEHRCARREDGRPRDRDRDGARRRVVRPPPGPAGTAPAGPHGGGLRHGARRRRRGGPERQLLDDLPRRAGATGGAGHRAAPRDGARAGAGPRRTRPRLVECAGGRSRRSPAAWWCSPW